MVKTTSATVITTTAMPTIVATMFIVSRTRSSSKCMDTSVFSAGSGPPLRAQSRDLKRRRRTRLGDYFAEVLLLDQATAAAKARATLG